MARKLASEMTQEELERKHQKAAERRAQRKDDNKAAMLELLEHLDCDMSQLSETTQHVIQVLCGEFVRAQIAVNEGDTLAELFMRHQNLSYKKLEKKCMSKGLVIKDGKVVKA